MLLRAKGGDQAIKGKYHADEGQQRREALRKELEGQEFYDRSSVEDKLAKEK